MERRIDTAKFNKKKCMYTIIIKGILFKTGETVGTEQKEEIKIILEIKVIQRGIEEKIIHFVHWKNADNVTTPEKFLLNLMKSCNCLSAAKHKIHTHNNATFSDCVNTFCSKFDKLFKMKKIPGRQKFRSWFPLLIGILIIFLLQFAHKS